jgi:hypothetical protein
MAGTQRECERRMGMPAQPISGVRNDGNPSFCASRGDRVVLAENLSYPALPAAAGALMRFVGVEAPARRQSVCALDAVINTRERVFRSSNAMGGGIKASLSEGSEHHHPSRARHPIAPFFPLTHLPRDVHRRQQRAALGAVPQRPGACGDCVGRRRLTLRSSRRCGRTQRTVCTGHTTTAVRTPRWTSSRRTTSGTSTSARSRSSTTWARSRLPVPCRRRT